MTDRSFPDGFLWGSSTNAQQFEGGWQEGDKGPSIADKRDPTMWGTPEIAAFDAFKIASDHYHHLEEDIDLYGEMGFTIYRFSMAWSRLFPRGDETNPCQAGLDFYDRMLKRLEMHHIQPVCTLYAYDMPAWLAEEKGGFLNRSCVDDYLRYVNAVSQYFKGRIKYYVPFNEQNTMADIAQYACGVNADTPDKHFLLDHHLNLAWAQATVIIHRNDPDAKVGGNVCNTCVYPANCHPDAIRAADMQNAFFGYAYADIFVRRQYSPFFRRVHSEADMDALIQPGDLEIIAAAEPDFLSLTYYMSTIADQYGHVGDTLLNTKNANPYVQQTEWGWNIDPYGFQHFLVDFAHRYHMPILVLENGLGHTDRVEENGEINDIYRIRYLRDHIRAMREAISLGANVLGYCTWSATDLFSTHEGFEKRYGFVYVDSVTLERKRKRSFWWYQQVIASNGQQLDE
ncbi:MAG: glycoside hydrolase family 1 protein [Clostridia bacterium]|nr:glycoside hydrolase family 1 protein [Clostridia bacterium]